MPNPWANAIATIPGRPTPPPTTAAATAPMNTNEKVPMNSARCLATNRLHIVDSRDEMTIRRDQVSARERYAGWGVADGTGERRRPAKRTGLLRGYHLRFEINAQRLRDACAVGGVSLVDVDDLPLYDLDRDAFHRCLVVMQRLLLLVRRELPEKVARFRVST